MKKSLFLFVIIGIFVLSACSNNEETDSNNTASWPEKDININIHAGPGNLDTAIRQLSPMLESVFNDKVNVIANNKPGGGQAVSQTDTQKEDADGYTFQTITSSTSFGMAMGQIPFSPEDWSMVSSLQKEPASIAVKSDSDLETIDDFVNKMKEDSSALTVGGYQNDGYMRYVYYKLQKMEDFDGKWIPIDTTDEVATNLLGGHIDVAIMTPSTALSAVQNDEVRLLGIADEEEVDSYPGVETFKDQGYDMVEVLYRGIMVKKGTSEEIIDEMHEAIQEATKSEEWEDFQEKQNQEEDRRTPEELDENLKKEVKERDKFLEDIGVK